METDPCSQLEVRLYKFAKMVELIAEGKTKSPDLSKKGQEETVYEKIMRSRGTPVVLKKKEEIIEIPDEDYDSAFSRPSSSGASTSFSSSAGSLSSREQTIATIAEESSVPENTKEEDPDAIIEAPLEQV